MDKKEKILALELLLEDMRGSFPLEGYDDERMVQARNLADDLNYKAHQDSIEWLANTEEYRDGRYFRCSFESGGYEGMSNIHKLPRTFHDKSEAFKKFILNFLQHPETTFEDWRDY